MYEPHLLHPQSYQKMLERLEKLSPSSKGSVGSFYPDLAEWRATAVGQEMTEAKSSDTRK